MNCTKPERRMILRGDKWYCLDCGSEFAVTDIEKEDMWKEEIQQIKLIL
jgi:hypothetical protein